MSIIYKLDELTGKEKGNGGKIDGLFALSQREFEIPVTFVVPANNFTRINDESFHTELQKVLAQFPSNSSLAIRSSALGEDGQQNSFAGIFNTVLNVPVNSYQDVYQAIRDVCSSLNTNVVAAYKAKNSPKKMGLIIQQQINPLYAGVAFTSSLTEDGKDALFVEYVPGLGDKLVSGKTKAQQIVVPFDSKGELDEQGIYFSGTSSKNSIKQFIPTLIHELKTIRDKFSHPMDIEWAIDKNGKVWMLQARPITKRIFVPKRNQSEDNGIVVSYGKGIVSGKTYFISGDLEEGKELDSAIKAMPDNAVLILDYSDTYYLPAMKKASAILSTNGSVLAHAAIVARELGIPCIVGLRNANKLFPDGTTVTIDPSSGSVKSPTQSITGNKQDMEWAELDIYDSIREEKIKDTTTLFEKSPNGQLAVHLPEEVDSSLIDDVEEYSRKNYHKSPKQYQTEKYLWYFENKRFQKIPLFNTFVDKGKKVCSSLDEKQVKNYFNLLKLTAKKLTELRESAKSNYDKFLLDETIVAIHFAAALRIAQGEAIAAVYKKLKSTLEKQGLSFVDFMSLKGNEKILKDSPLISKGFRFMKVLEDERNNIFQYMLDIKAMRPDYFDDRDKRAQKAILCKRRKDAVDVFYEHISKTPKKKVNLRIPPVKVKNPER